MDRGWVYVLHLENNCWYVGWTSNPRKRMYRHFKDTNVAWVRRYAALDVAYQFYGTQADEEAATLQLAHWFGIAKVRGGRYTRSDDHYKQETLPPLIAGPIPEYFWLT